MTVTGLMPDSSPTPRGPAATAADEPAVPAIQARGLVKTFGPIRAVDGIDLAIRAGEVRGLVPEGVLESVKQIYSGRDGKIEGS